MFKKAEKGAKARCILSLLKTFNDISWEIIKPNTVVRVGTHDKLARTKSSEAQEYIEQQQGVVNKYKNPKFLRVQAIFKLPLVPPEPCSFEKVYLI